MIIALMTNKNNPNVNSVTGIVNSTKTGFKNVFNKPITMATHKAPNIEVIWTPGKKYESPNTTIELMSNLIIKFIGMEFSFYYKKKTSKRCLF
jgi:hypothetical protein